MKIQIVLLAAMLTTWTYATPSANCYSSVTNDWHQGKFSNVYELAQMRLTSNSNDVVATYIMHDWNLSFRDVGDISNGVTRIIEVSDCITNSSFAAEFRRLRPAYIEYRDVFLPTITKNQLEAERHKSYLPHQLMVSSYMLQLLDREGLW